jgi:hypothetical protein
MSVLPPGTVTTASKGGIVVATNLHVVSLSVAAYEYVPGRILLLPMGAHIRPATSSPFLTNSSCTGPPIERGEKG